MRVGITENKGMEKEKKVILDVGTVEKRKNYGFHGDCLIIDGMVFETGKKTDELYLFMLQNGYLDLLQQDYFNVGI